MTTNEPAEEPVEQPQYQQAAGKGCLRSGLFALALFVAFGFWACSNLGSSGSSQRGPSEVHAVSICETAISQQLKDPGSADFLDDRKVVTTGVGKWTITGTVIATNSFGGPSRITYNCDAWTDDNDLYEARAKLTE